MPKLKILLFSILFLIAGITVLFFSSNNYKQVLAGDPLKVGDEVDVQIEFTSSKNIVSAEFQIKINNGQLVNLRCAEGSTFSKTYGDATSCLLGHFEGGSTSGVLAVARIEATAVGDLKVIGDGVLYDLDGNDVTGASYIEVLHSVTEDDSNPVEVVCKDLTAIAKDSAEVVVDFSSLRNDFVGKITLTCEGKSKGGDINAIFFTFEKDGELISSDEGDGTPAENIVSTECNPTEKSSGFECFIGSATFEISGAGNYSASSKVCIGEGASKICSPNATN